IRKPPGSGTKNATQFKGRFDKFFISPGFDTRYIGYQGNIKGQKKPLKGGGSITRSGWNNKGNALIRKPPSSGTKNATQFKGRFDRFFISPGFDTRYIGYQGNIKERRKKDYKHNPNSHEDALKTVAPKSSAYKAMTFQGNFKSKKTYKKGMHPSAKYTTSQKRLNSLEEKDKILKFRIWWAKLIKRNENQPPIVKEKVRKPRYSTSAKDLWYD
ncbi:MAG: hypothetical protein OEW67_06590, partial [Cyclobacteriaceae bacterium]|nr:hypothetical protein [Cyclobacteriaceae bacterium]